MAPPTISLDSQDRYTVGWIAALAGERTAAMAMLEEPHRKPRNYKKAHNDPNAYSWGRIGEHNVVIASLPASRIGEVSAATTASYMLATFPNIRIGLMVGIGAGVPEAEPDIRLGDVAVSMPEGTSGGVIQYDLGKIKPNGTFERKGALNAPPQALLSALGLIQSEHRLNGHRINEFVNDMLQNHPTLSQPNGKEPAYTRPDAATDRLFDAKYQHKGGENCNDCVKGNPLMFKRDEPRKVPSPQVFYGTIASGDKVVKDAAARAAVIKDAGEKCICIEMEAAGLMNTFPCLVIRGICDYADSHKNDEWHSYAAATAAAYARELLENIDVDDVEDTPKASEVVENPRQKPPPATNKLSDNSVTQEQLEELRKRVDELKKLISNDGKENSPTPRIECGRSTVVRKPDGSGTRVNFKKPFARVPVVTVTARMTQRDPFYNQRVYLLRDPPAPSTTREYFIVGCWGGNGGGTGTKLEYDWIAVEPDE